VDLQRSYRDVPLSDGVEVRTRPGILLRSGRPHPVDGTAPRVLRADNGLGAVAKAQPAGAKAPQLPERHVRDVDVEDQSAFQGLAQQLTDKQSRHSRTRVEMPAALRPGAQGDGDGGQTEEPPFDG